MMKKLIKYFLFSLIILSAFAGNGFAQLNWNQAGKFNGPNTYSYLTVPNSSEFNNIDEIMIETWICFSSFPGNQYIFLDKGNANYRIAYSFGQLYLRTTNASAGSSDLAYSITLNANRWYHVAAIVRDTFITGINFSKVRELYLDGVLLKRDSQGFQSATLGSSSDSLLIGGFGAPNFGHAMLGYLDDIRIWAGHFTGADVLSNYRTSLNAWGNSSNYYNKCILSIPFQDSDNSSPFSVFDGSRYNHIINNNNVTAFSLSDKPSVTCYNNLSVHLNGSSDYLAGPDHINNSPDVQITMEAWVYPEKTYTGAFTDLGTIICKGTSAYNYRLYLGAGNSVYATINGNNNFGYAGDVVAPQNKWTHIAFTYTSSGGEYNYYINGELAGTGTNGLGNVTNGTDSLYIGQAGGTYFFQGYLDEVRISGYAKTQTEINNFLYKAMDLNDRPSVFDLSCYNFDGGLTNNNGGAPRMYFRNGATFSSRYISSIKNFPVSPLLKADFYAFPSAWYTSNRNFRIPETGTQGTSQYDTINIPYCRGVLDINVFLALNHTYEKDLTVYLIAPSGESVELVKNNEMERGQFITIFNDQADSSIVNNRYTSFLPNIKPFTSISSVMSGVNMKGTWRLLVNDGANADTGRVYGWGLQFNNMLIKPNLMTLTATANQGGFWTGSSQPADTVRMYLRQTTAPYTKVDSAIGYINQFGFSTTYLANALNGSYYIEYCHRNSLAVWSILPKSFSQGGSTSFSILTGPSTVYGGDLISINGRWCMYSGDINQDGAINGNDFTIFNTQFGLNGYLVSDLNGDNTVNGNDFTIFNTGFGHQTNHP